MNEQQSESQSELLSRIDLIEAMVQEGRRRIEYWGWTQVLWGSAYLIAIGWTYGWGRPALAWPICMIAATVIMIAVGTALFLYCFSIAYSGHSEVHAYMAAIEILLGVANFAGGMILRWRAPLIVGLVWWAAGVATAFVRTGWVYPIFIAAILFCMIGFGLYLMYRERRDRRRRATHA